MALRLALRRSPAYLQALSCLSCARKYATVRPVLFAGQPPEPPAGPITTPSAVESTSSLDASILSQLQRIPTAGLPLLSKQFDDNSAKVLHTSLPYESRPSAERRVSFEGDDGSVLMVAHAAQLGDQHKVSVCSGFALNVAQEDANGQSLSVMLTCAHTLQEVNHAPCSWEWLTSPTNM